MKKYLIVLSVLAFVGCNDSKKEEQARLNAVRQRTIDSMTTVNNATKAAEVHTASRHHHSASTRHSSTSTTSVTKHAHKKGMSNTTKGALIGTGVGVVGGAVTGAATSKDKAKGAVIGGVIGGAVGSGVGYGIGAHKDKKEASR